MYQSRCVTLFNIVSTTRQFIFFIIFRMSWYHYITMLTRFRKIAIVFDRLIVNYLIIVLSIIFHRCRLKIIIVLIELYR